jgi:hypothetical protein
MGRRVLNEINHDDRRHDVERSARERKVHCVALPELDLRILHPREAYALRIDIGAAHVVRAGDRVRQVPVPAAVVKNVPGQPAQQTQDRAVTPPLVPSLPAVPSEILRNTFAMILDQSSRVDIHRSPIPLTEAALTGHECAGANPSLTH